VTTAVNEYSGKDTCQDSEFYASIGESSWKINFYQLKSIIRGSTQGTETHHMFPSSAQRSSNASRLWRMARGWSPRQNAETSAWL